jgi:hypothetical protein
MRSGWHRIIKRICTFFYSNGKANDKSDSNLFVHEGVISVVKRTGIVSNRLSDIILSGHSCDINIILDMYASNENKSVDKKRMLLRGTRACIQSIL